MNVFSREEVFIIRKVLASLLRHSSSREIVDPVHGERYVIHGSDNRLILKNEESVLHATDNIEEVMKALQPIYEHFRSNIDLYLSKVKERRTWRFFDVAYGVDVIVDFRADAEDTRLSQLQPLEWGVWMGEDLSLHTTDQAEVHAYIRGLITEFEPWWEKELRKLQEAIKQKEES